jgi:hypothetical protein
MLPARITSAHFAVSISISSLNAAGEPDGREALTLSSHSLTDASASTALISLLNPSTTSVGAPRKHHRDIDMISGARFYFYFQKVAGWVISSFIVAGLAGFTK